VNAVALMYAVMKGYFDIVKCLTDHGAHVNAVTAYGETALMKATEGDHSDIAEYLKQKMKKS